MVTRANFRLCVSYQHWKGTNTHKSENSLKSTAKFSGHIYPLAKPQDRDGLCKETPVLGSDPWQGMAGAGGGHTHAGLDMGLHSHCECFNHLLLWDFFCPGSSTHLPPSSCSFCSTVDSEMLCSVLPVTCNPDPPPCSVPGLSLHFISIFSQSSNCYCRGTLNHWVPETRCLHLELSRESGTQTV